MIFAITAESFVTGKIFVGVLRELEILNIFSNKKKILFICKNKQYWEN